MQNSTTIKQEDSTQSFVVFDKVKAEGGGKTARYKERKVLKMEKYRKFYIKTEAYVVFTENEKQYIRKLQNKKGILQIRFNNKNVLIQENEIY